MTSTVSFTVDDNAENNTEEEREKLIQDLDKAEQDLLKAFRDASRAVVRGGDQANARALLEAVEVLFRNI